MREIKAHNLKTWPDYFEAVWDGMKLFEVRKADRPFGIADILVLREWEPISATYSGRVVQASITYILEGGQFGIEEGYCVLGMCVVFKGKMPPDGEDG